MRITLSDLVYELQIAEATHGKSEIVDIVKRATSERCIDVYVTDKRGECSVIRIPLDSK